MLDLHLRSPSSFLIRILESLSVESYFRINQLATRPVERFSWSELKLRLKILPESTSGVNDFCALFCSHDTDESPRFDTGRPWNTTNWRLAPNTCISLSVDGTYTVQRRVRSSSENYLRFTNRFWIFFERSLVAGYWQTRSYPPRAKSVP